jgi:replication initiation protein RepC
VAGTPAGRQPRPNAATEALAPRLLLRLSPQLGTYLTAARPAWADVVDAADHLRSQLGISRDAWIDACQTLGRQDAAACIGVIAAKATGIRSPGGYLRAMTERARDGRLNLVRSLWGLAEERADG